MSVRASKQNERNELRKLAFERIFLIGIGFFVITGGVFLIKVGVEKERMELAILTNPMIDTPTRLQKVRTNSSRVLADRWVRGFVRRYLSGIFPSPRITRVNAIHALQWMHAHSGNKGQNRAKVLYREIDTWLSTMKIKRRDFKPDIASDLTLRENKETGLIYATIPGAISYISEEGRASSGDVKLTLVIEKVPISGEVTTLGQSNLSGLRVIDGYFDHAKGPSGETLPREELFLNFGG